MRVFKGGIEQLETADLENSGVQLGGQYTFTLPNPAVSDRVALSAGLKNNITITKVYHQTDAGTADWNVYSGANPHTTTANALFSADEQSTTTRQTETSFSGENQHSAGDALVFVCSAVSSATRLYFTVEYELT